MKIYKTHYLEKDTVYQILGNVEKDIPESYTGGAVDVYIPHNGVGYFDSKERKELYYYDANSLYPFVIHEFEMPTGKPIAFEGDIRKVDPNAYGFFYCKISTPSYLEHPILQRRIKTTDGIRTVAGLGTWEGWIFSKEMDNAIEHGYTFEIIKGYKFTPKNLFNVYMNVLYNLRQQFSKSHALNLIAKLLMNALYGKFGMKPVKSLVEIYDQNNESHKENLKFNFDTLGESIQDYVQLDNFLIVVRDNLSNYKYSEKDDMFHGSDVNVAIASAITAGGRIHMSYFKNRQDIKIYYSDTDSLIVDSPLPSECVGNLLGEFKLEHVIRVGYFIAPPRRGYGFITTKGEEIVKVKGLTNKTTNMSTITLSELLIKDSQKEFTQEKWYKNIFTRPASGGGKITTKQIAYRLKCTSNKREAVYEKKKLKYLEKI